MIAAYQPRRRRGKLIITGVDDMIGANLAIALADRYDVLGLYDYYPVALDGCRSGRWRPEEPQSVAAMVRRERPRWVIHCGQIARSSWHPPLGVVDADHEFAVCSLLADVCHEVKAPLTVLTTDAVCDSPRLFHDETSSAIGGNPLALAAQQVEAVIAGSGALLIRTHAYGWNPCHGRPGLVEQLWRMLIEGAGDCMLSNRHATPILAHDLADLLEAAYKHKLSGAYNLAGAERISMARFADEFAVAFGLRRRHVPAENDQPDSPGETSLDSRRARSALGCNLPMVREGLARFARQTADGIRARFRGVVPMHGTSAAARFPVSRRAADRPDSRSAAMPC